MFNQKIEGVNLFCSYGVGGRVPVSYLPDKNLFLTLRASGELELIYPLDLRSVYTKNTKIVMFIDNIDIFSIGQIFPVAEDGTIKSHGIWFSLKTYKDYVIEITEETFEKIEYIRYLIDKKSDILVSANSVSYRFIKDYNQNEVVGLRPYLRKFRGDLDVFINPAMYLGKEFDGIEHNLLKFSTTFFESYKILFMKNQKETAYQKILKRKNVKYFDFVDRIFHFDISLLN